jgi:hypothetical protein
MRRQLLVLSFFVTELNRWSVDVAQPLVAIVLGVKGIRMVRHGGGVHVNCLCAVEDLVSDRFEQNIKRGAC